MIEFVGRFCKTLSRVTNKVLLTGNNRTICCEAFARSMKAGESAHPSRQVRVLDWALGEDHCHQAWIKHMDKVFGEL
jgi:hypothetical protein